MVRLTSRGRRLETTINQQAQAAERHIAELLGPRRFAQLRDALDELAHHLTEN